MGGPFGVQRRCKGMKENEGNEGRRMLRIWFSGEAMLSLREAPDCNPSTIKEKNPKQQQV